MLKRRDFLQAMGVGAAGAAFSACVAPASKTAPELPEAARLVKPLIDPQTLEKPNLVVGFVPVNDCAPFAVAWEKGFFRKYGLNVTLSRESSWANARDGIIFGRLDAAPVVSGAVTNARTGAEGARHAPLCAAMTIHRHGNAMTMDRAIWEAGVRPWYEYGGDLELFGEQIRNYFTSIPIEQRSWSVVLSSAIYEYFVRYLIAATGISPEEEFRLLITPPPQMVNGLRIGSMQAYMVAEPWNTRAIAGNEGVGFTFAQGREIWRGHPDRLLGVMESFIQENPKTYRSLVKAMIEACRYCSEPKNRPEVAQLISARTYTGAKPRNPGAAIDKFTRPGIVGDYSYGGFDGNPRLRNSPETTLFFDLPEDLKAVPEDHSTFLWQSQSLWLMTQAARWGQIPEIPSNALEIVKKAWKTDLYREIASEIGIDCPKEDYKLEKAEFFIDQKPFDPSDPVGYLQSFEIRAQRPKLFYFS
jgi:nitrate/nitrite transport system substrate-binding protein